jgi:hypothetical protein
MVMINDDSFMKSATKLVLILLKTICIRNIYKRESIQFALESCVLDLSPSSISVAYLLSAGEVFFI